MIDFRIMGCIKMKRVITLVFLLIVICLAGCAENKETIEGYWMSESGETISFNSNGKAISDGMSMDYSLYGEDNLSISFWGMASEYRYTVKNDVLTLVDLSKNATSIFYRDEEKQKEIQKRLDEIKTEQQRQEEIEKEKEEHEKYIKSLQSDISYIELQISTQQDFIRYAEEDIENYQSDIEGFIKEPEIYDEEFINSYKESIKERENDIVGYREEISRLEQKKTELEQKLMNSTKQ